MRHLLKKYFYKILLIIIFCLVFVQIIENSGFRNCINPEILTLEEEKKLLHIVYRPLHQVLDTLLEKSVLKYGFNGSLMIAHNDRVVYQFSSGYADFQKKIKISVHTPFQLASVSKQFTAMAVMILHDRGKLSYDDPVKKYLHQFPYDEITIRHLLNHTSGLPNYMWIIEDTKETDSLVPSNNDVIQMLADSNLNLNFIPGSRFDYSNTGYAVLASLVEQISGDPFDVFLEKEIFIALGMKNSFVSESGHIQQEGTRVTGYRRSWGRFTEYGESSQDGIVGDKGIYSSVYDLFLWDKALNGNTLVKKSTLQEAYTPGKLKNNRQIPYGFGFRLKNEGGQHVVYHHGRWNGFRTAFEKYLPENTTIIVLNNTSFNGISTLITRIRESMINTGDRFMTEEIIHTLITDGSSKALDSYRQIRQDHPFFRIDPQILDEVSHFLKNAGKTKKADEVGDFTQKLSS